MRTLLFYFLIFAFFACKKNENECTRASDSYSYQLNKAVDTARNEVTIVGGSKVVFKFTHNYEQCRGAVGGFTRKSVYFELPPDVSSFNFSDNAALSQAGAVAYLEAPVNPQMRVMPISLGYIQGVKTTGGVWHIKGAVNAHGEVVEFEAGFTRVD